MAFNTQTLGHILIGDENVVFGTVLLGEEYGQISTCDLTRTGDETEIDNNVGGLKALIMSKLGLELKMEVIFTADKTPPGPGEPVTFPFVDGIIGFVTPGAAIKWTQKGSRMLSFTAKYFDSMAVETVEDSGIFHNPAFRVALDGTTTPFLGDGLSGS